MANGEAFDRVELLGSDERRDIAALKISAGALPVLATGSTPSLAQGDPVYAVTNASGLTWSATEGILSAIRPATEVPAAGSGFRLLQFSAPVAPGSSGGALVDRSGALIGVITSGNGSAGFAVPIENVIGLPDSAHRIALGAGSSLQLASKMTAQVPQSSAAIVDSDARQILKNARTIYISSKTSFLTVDTLDRALALEKDWQNLGLTIVQDPRVADLLITIDRPLFARAAQQGSGLASGRQDAVGIHRRAAHDQASGWIRGVVFDDGEHAAWPKQAPDFHSESGAHRRRNVVIDANRGDEVELRIVKRDFRGIPLRANLDARSPNQACHSTDRSLPCGRNRVPEA
jgi:hypothetical protein